MPPASNTWQQYSSSTPLSHALRSGWTAFGFAAENQVPGPDGKLMFASVKRDGIEIMYQTKASVLVENPAQASELAGRSATLFITVADVGAAERAAAGAPIVKPLHQTSYGSTEFYVRDPAGNVIGFAQFGK
jgi:uncharacterized glyoxalase superfamily protein PhnB